MCRRSLAMDLPTPGISVSDSGLRCFVLITASVLGVIGGGGDRTRTCKGFHPAVFKTASLPLGYPSLSQQCDTKYRRPGSRFSRMTLLRPYRPCGRMCVPLSGNLPSEGTPVAAKKEVRAKKNDRRSCSGERDLRSFLRPFNGCVPQPEKKRRLFDSHNPNSLMVAEWRDYSKHRHCRESPILEKQSGVSSLSTIKLQFCQPPQIIESILLTGADPPG